MAGSAQDVQRQIVSMIISQRLQDQADEKRNQQRLQESILSSQIARREKLEDEQRQFKRQLLMKGVDAKLEAARAGENVDLGGLPELLVSQIGGVQQDARKEQAYQALTQATFDPGNGNLAAAQAAAFQAGLGSPTIPGSGWEKTNKEIVRRRAIEQGRRTQASDDARTQANITNDAALYKEQTGKTWGETTDSLASVIAARRLGSDAFTDEDVAESAAIVRNAFRNAPPEIRNQAVSAAVAKSNKKIADDFFKQRSAQGMTPDQVEADALKAYLQAKDAGVADPVGSLGIEQRVSLMRTGKLVPDPVTGREELFNSKTLASKWYESREATRDLLTLGDDVISAWVDVEQNADPTKVGALIGSQGGQELLNRFGVQDPYAAAYSTVSFRFVSTVLKATQGSRPSDFDLRMYMALLPTLTEVGSDSAMARLGNMNDMLSMAANAPNDPALQDRIEKIREQPMTREDRLLENAAKRLGVAATAGDQADIARATREFQQAHDRWVGSGGRKKFSVVKDAKPGVSADFDDALYEQLSESGSDDSPGSVGDREKTYVEKYHDETVRQGAARKNQDGTSTTVLMGTVTLDGRRYLIPFYDRKNKRTMSAAEAIEAAMPDIVSGRVDSWPEAWSGDPDSHPAEVAAREAHDRIEFGR